MPRASNVQKRKGKDFLSWFATEILGQLGQGGVGVHVPDTAQSPNDYATLITRGDNWKEIFSAVFRDKDDVKVSFKWLEPLRVIPMHSRPVTKAHLLTIGAETTRILAAIGVLLGRERRATRWTAPQK